jgi:four helix bundle protein
MSRTRHYRDLIAWQKAMELARQVYASTEQFPQSETFGLRMQLRRSAVNAATYVADGHGRLNDAENRKSLGIARGAINELQTQLELAESLNFVDKQIAERSAGPFNRSCKTDQRPSRRPRSRSSMTRYLLTRYRAKRG